MSSDPTTQIQELLNHYATNHIGVVAGIISPSIPSGTALLFAGTGDLLNTLHSPLLLDGDTIFKLASVTKIFTSVVQYNIHSNYDGALGDYITAVSLPPGLATLPLLNLANYSPGFPTDNNGTWVPHEALQTLPNLLEYLSTASDLPQNPTGTCYSYSNFGWALLALAALGVPNESGDIYPVWMQAIEAIAEALNLTHTQPWVSTLISDLPVGHNADGSMLPPNYNYGLLNPMLFGAGSLVTSGNDMMKWLQFNMGFGSNPPMDMFELQQGQTFQFDPCSNPTKSGPVVGLGWFFQNKTINNQEVTYLWKNGGHSGFTSWMGFQSWFGTGEPSPIGCFVLTNSDNADVLGTTAIKILFGDSNPVIESNEVHYVPA